MEKDIHGRFVENTGWATWFKVVLIGLLLWNMVQILMTLPYIGYTEMDTGSVMEPAMLLVGIIVVLGPNLLGLLSTAGMLLKKRWGYIILIVQTVLTAIALFTGMLSVTGLNLFSGIGMLIASIGLPVFMIIAVQSGIATNTGSNIF